MDEPPERSVAAERGAHTGPSPLVDRFGIARVRPVGVDIITYVPAVLEENIGFAVLSIERAGQEVLVAFQARPSVFSDVLGIIRIGAILRHVVADVLAVC